MYIYYICIYNIFKAIRKKVLVLYHIVFNFSCVFFCVFSYVFFCAFSCVFSCVFFCVFFHLQPLSSFLGGLRRDFGKRCWIDVDVVELKKLEVVEFEIGYTRLKLLKSLSILVKYFILINYNNYIIYK